MSWSYIWSAWDLVSKVVKAYAVAHATRLIRLNTATRNFIWETTTTRVSPTEFPFDIVQITSTIFPHS